MGKQAQRKIEPYKTHVDIRHAYRTGQIDKAEYDRLMDLF